MLQIRECSLYRNALKKFSAASFNDLVLRALFLQETKKSSGNDVACLNT